MQFDSLKAYVFDRLEKNLDSTLHYHGAHHTHYVYDAALRIAGYENITGEDHVLLMTAILFHDAGFLQTYTDHEEKSCELAREILPRYNYTPEQIDRICAMIMRTKIPQIAFNKLEEIICDADLDYLGTDDFIPIGNQLFKEFLHYGVVKNEEAWNRLQLKFLTAHQYFTDYAKKYREAKKQQNLQLIIEIVKTYEPK